jgi:hypothetical protein
MKSFLLSTGLLTCLTLGCFQGEASAESTLSSKCVKPYGEITQGKNPSYQHINCLLTNAALKENIPPEIIKAVATQENSWRQFNENGEPVISKDGGIGIMQITNSPDYESERLKSDISYNIEYGAQILSSKYRGKLPKINGMGQQVLENWYFPVMAYNGIKPVNSPLIKETGKKNEAAYQEKVFTHLKAQSYLNDTSLAPFPFSINDFKYDSTKPDNIIFEKKGYTLSSQMHESNYVLKAGNGVVVTKDGVNLRKEPGGNATVKKLTKNTTLIIYGIFSYDQFKDSKNQFVWYPVKYKTTDKTTVGYISSAYITKKLDLPLTNAVDDNDTILSGTAPASATIRIMNGKTLVATTIANSSGKYTTKIPVQKAATQLTVSYKNTLNAVSPSTVIKVIDKTPPKPPVINSIKRTAKTVTGKTESLATVQLKVGSKIIGSGKAASNGLFKISIKQQKSATTVTATAKDIAGNTSKATSTKVK